MHPAIRPRLQPNARLAWPQSLRAQVPGRPSGATSVLLLRALLLGGLAVAAAGCQTPCKQLEQRLCERSTDDAACERWKERIGRVSSGTCEIGLRTLDREALR